LRDLSSPKIAPDTQVAQAADTYVAQAPDTLNPSTASATMAQKTIPKAVLASEALEGWVPMQDGSGRRWLSHKDIWPFSALMWENVSKALLEAKDVDENWGLPEVTNCLYKAGLGLPAGSDPTQRQGKRNSLILAAEVLKEEHRRRGTLITLPKSSQNGDADKGTVKNATGTGTGERVGPTVVVSSKRSNSNPDHVVLNLTLTLTLTLTLIGGLIRTLIMWS